MGQTCCTQVKVESGLNTQASFNREIEEHLNKLQSDRLLKEAQEQGSQVNNLSRIGSTQIAYYDPGKDVPVLNQSMSALFSSQQGNSVSGGTQQELRFSRQRSNENSKAAGVSGSSQQQIAAAKNQQAYEDYEVRVIDASLLRDPHNTSIVMSSSEKGSFVSQNSKENVKQSRSVDKQGSILKNSNNNILQDNYMKTNTPQSASEDPTKPILMSPYASNEESPNTSSAQEDDDPNNRSKNAAGIAAAAATGASAQNSATAGSSTNIRGKRVSNNEKQNSGNLQPGSSKVIESGANAINQQMQQQQQQQQTNPAAGNNSGVNTDAMRENFLQNGGRKSILMNTLANRDDPNSGSVSYMSDDQQGAEAAKKKKERRVKLLITPDKQQRFDTDQGYHGGGNGAGGGDSADAAMELPKLKGVLKKYDPNNPTFSDIDSPRRENRSKKKVKFKESTFKKSTKKKK